MGDTGNLHGLLGADFADDAVTAGCGKRELAVDICQGAGKAVDFFFHNGFRISDTVVPGFDGVKVEDVIQRQKLDTVLGFLQIAG